MSTAFLAATADAQTVVNVSNAAQLHSAVSAANSAGGNRSIVLSDGVYTLSDTLYINVPNVSLSSQSADRTRVTIQGDAMSASASVKNLIRVAASNFTIRDLTLQRAGWHLIQIAGENNADSPVVRNVVFRDAYQQMLKVTTDASNPGADSVSSNNGLVEDSLFEYTAGRGPQYYIGGIDAHGGKNWTVRENVFRGIASPSGAVAEFAVHFWNRSADNIIERNVIIDCDRGIGFGLGTKPNSGGVIRNNMIYHSANGAPYADVGIALTESPGSRVYNNTVILESGFPWTIEYYGTPTTGVQIVNNLLNGPVQQREGASGSVSNNVTNAAGSWFVNRAAGNLRLASAVSSVVDRAVNVTGLVDDIDGQARPQGAASDIGADEYGGTTAVTPRPPTNVQAM